MPLDTQLTVLPPGSEIALPPELIDRASAYAEKALSERTREAYDRAWRHFAGWCQRHSRPALPASPATIAGWLTDLADGADGSKALARASINQMLAGVVFVHRNAGHSIDRKHRTIAMVWSGISRTKAMTEIERQAAPFLAKDVADALGLLNRNLSSGCRDACLLTLGWGAALRRSELVGLDFEVLGEGTGFVRMDERGILVTLARSKASPEKAETVVIPRADLPEACDALEAWARRAELRPGDPIVRGVNNRDMIAATRLAAHSVPRIVKKLMRDLARSRGRSDADAKELVKRFSGHSLRCGFVTSAAAVDVPALRIAGHTRHRSIEMVSRYCREADKYSRSALRGILHRAPKEAA